MIQSDLYPLYLFSLSRDYDFKQVRDKETFSLSEIFYNKSTTENTDYQNMHFRIEDE